MAHIRTADLPARTLYRAQIGSPALKVFWEAPALESVAALFPEYQIEVLLGEGGMGLVYRARHLATQRVDAIKLLPLEVSNLPAYQRHFAKEAKVLERLDHPRVVAVRGSGAVGGYSYIAMEYVAGRSLLDFVHDRATTLLDAVVVVREACEGLAYAHAQGVVHRDVKPANILVDEAGHAKVVDFGVAKLTLP